MCKSFAPRSRQITTPVPHHSVFYRPDALLAAQPTASKHWRQLEVNLHNCVVFLLIFFVYVWWYFIIVIYTAFHEYSLDITFTCNNLLFNLCTGVFSDKHVLSFIILLFCCCDVHSCLKYSSVVVDSAVQLCVCVNQLSVVLFAQITLLNLPLPGARNVSVTVYELSSDSLACPDGLCKWYSLTR